MSTEDTKAEQSSAADPQGRNEALVMRNGSTITFKGDSGDKYVGSGFVCCQNCGTPWEDDRAALHCPCLDA